MKPESSYAAIKNSLIQKSTYFDPIAVRSANEPRNTGGEKTTRLLLRTQSLILARGHLPERFWEGACFFPEEAMAERNVLDCSA